MTKDDAVHNKPSGSLTLAVLSLLTGLVTLIVSRAYYAFYYLPNHHGSWPSAMKRMFDLDGWWSYAVSQPGLVFHGVALASFVVFAVSLWRVRRILAESDGTV